MSSLCVMGPSGDTKTIWDKNKPDEVAAARQQFNTLRQKGYLAFRVQPGGKPGEQVFEFDPNAEQIILSPPVAGG